MSPTEKENLLLRIREAGVIGAGGAGFPTYKKLENPVEHLIANGAECEPLLYKDREAMRQEAETLVEGLRVMRALTGARTATIAVKHKNADVAEALRPLAEPHGIGFLVYRDVYPAGDEYVLVHEVTGRQIPPGGIPLQVGCVVDNVETIINVAHASHGRPVTAKYVTVTGAVANPLTTRVPVGISYRDCIAAAGGATAEPFVILTGGVMMGGLVRDPDLPVAKNVGGIIVLPAEHYLARRKSSPRETYTRIGHGQCDQCSLCTEMCPRYIMGYPIEPHRVMRTLLMTGEAKARASLWAQYCCECNVCSLIACPEQLDPKNICADAKALLRREKLSRTERELESLFRGIHPARAGREIPIGTLYRRLGLDAYDRKAPFTPDAVRPSSLVVPLSSHVGAPCKPVVTPGQRVSAGDVLGRTEPGQLGCPAHAPLAGNVTAVDARGVHLSVARPT